MPPTGVKSRKRARQYEKVLKSIKSEGRYKGRQKEVAARIVNKTRRRKGETKRRKAA
jgi:membrane-bound ClpP family serine protease